MGKDALTLLKEDHQKVRQMLKRLQSNATEDLLNQVETELKIHTQIEEEIFYPAFRDALLSHKDEHLYFEAIEEHHVVDLVLPEIMESSEGSEELRLLLRVLRGMTRRSASPSTAASNPTKTRLRELSLRLKHRYPSRGIAPASSSTAPQNISVSPT